MSAVFQTVTDPTRGQTLLSRRDENLATTRYLFLAGNLLDPDRVFELEYLRDSGGGEEVQTHCLRRSTGGYIQRGKIVPMETWVEALPAVLLGEGSEDNLVRVEGPTSELPGRARNPGDPRLAGVGSTLVHYKFYPGDEIKAVLRANEGKGIVEVKALFGEPWYADDDETKPGTAQLLNRDFFPSVVPPTLRGLRETIDEKQGRSEHHKAVAKDMFHSCDQFERYAQTRLGIEHNLLRQRTSPNGQYTFSYSPVARELLKQLEMKPQDSILEQMAGGINAEQLQAILDKTGGGGQQMSVEMISQMAGAIAQQLFAAQAQAQTVGAAEPVTTTNEPAKNRGGRPPLPRDPVTGEIIHPK